MRSLTTNFDWLVIYWNGAAAEKAVMQTLAEENRPDEYYYGVH